MTILRFPQNKKSGESRKADHPPCLCESCLDAAYMAMGGDEGGYESDPPRNSREWAEWEACLERRQETRKKVNSR